jgi:hypothetical protein
MEEYTSGMFENKVLSRIFVPQRDELTGGCKKLHNKEYQNLYFLLNIIRINKSRGVLGVVTRFIHPLLPYRQPHLPVAYPVSTDEALTPESQQDNCYISAGGNAGTHTVCPEALKVATLPLDCHSLG